MIVTFNEGSVTSSSAVDVAMQELMEANPNWSCMYNPAKSRREFTVDILPEDVPEFGIKWEVLDAKS